MANDEERGSSFIEYRPGNVGIILSIPHGGSKEDSCIPDRSNSYGMVDNLLQDVQVDSCQVLNQRNLNNNNNNKLIKNDISSEKLPIEENDTILSTTENKNCVNDNCFSTIPILSTTAKASGKLISLSKSVNKIRTSTDGWTIDLGEIMIKAMVDYFGGSLRPHVIICHLKRTKVDMNRDIVEGAQGNPVAMAAYKCYHDYIKRAQSSYNRGILFDLHGQSHGKNTTELGYLIPRPSLNCRLYNTNKSSVRALAEDNAGISGRDLIAGDESFGAMLEQEGYFAVPSPRQPFPGVDKYYSGGYITQSYGSLDVGMGEDSGALFDAIQLETPRESRIEGGEEERINYGKALSRVIVMFYRKYYYNELVQSLKMLG